LSGSGRGIHTSIFEKGLAWTLYKHMETDFVDYLDYVPYTTDNEGVYSPRLIGLLLEICSYIDSVFKAMAEYQAFKNDVFCREIVRRELKRDQTKKDLTQEPRSTAASELEKEIRNLPAMTLYCEAFEKLYSLSSNNGSLLIAKVGWEEPRKQANQKPFQSFSSPGKEKRDPEWWGKYNAVKHTWHNSIKEAKLRNVLSALAAAFLLNAVHLPSLRSLNEMGLVKYFIEYGPEGFEPRLHISTPSPKDFKESLDEAERCAHELKPVRFPSDCLIETQLFIYRHQREAV
jgi:hypothetical protein